MNDIIYILNYLSIPYRHTRSNDKDLDVNDVSLISVIEIEENMSYSEFWHSLGMLECLVQAFGKE
jgi:hypothetical protein